LQQTLQGQGLGRRLLELLDEDWLLDGFRLLLELGLPLLGLLVVLLGLLESDESLLGTRLGT